LIDGELLHADERVIAEVSRQIGARRGRRQEAIRCEQRANDRPNCTLLGCRSHSRGQAPRNRGYVSNPGRLLVLSRCTWTCLIPLPSLASRKVVGRGVAGARGNRAWNELSVCVHAVTDSTSGREKPAGSRDPAGCATTLTR
jgi:hypothetical protein